ncbi:MAG: DUF917 domain-containing protein [Gudongella sp.]|nr:DUF917 domain-containing protein [Gudongella sp.]
MKIKSIDKENMESFLMGLAILGTGGGGESEWGRKIIQNDIARGRGYLIVDPKDVEDEAFICSGGIMGSVKELDGISYDDVIDQWENDFPLVKALKKMEELKGRKLDYVIAFEPGGLNTPVIMSAAARMGIPIIDGDAVGRSAPETQMTSFIGHGISLNPMTLVDDKGNSIVVLESKESTYADEIGRFIVTKSGNMGANSHYGMSGKQLKKSCIPNTLSLATNIGDNIRNSANTGLNITEAFTEFIGGKMMFNGIINEVNGESRGGFYLINVMIEGKNEFVGKSAKIVIKNEVMALWINGEIKSIFPDNIFMLRPDEGTGIMSTDLTEGMKIVLVGTPCNERIRETLATEEGKEAFGGQRYGYQELNFIPFEELNK